MPLLFLRNTSLTGTFFVSQTCFCARPLDFDASQAVPAIEAALQMQLDEQAAPTKAAGVPWA